MRRGARVTALDYSAADLKDVAAVAGAMLDSGRGRRTTQWAGVVNADALDLPFPDDTLRPRDRLRGARAHLGRRARARRDRARAAARRARRGDGADALARARVVGAQLALPRHARRSRPHLPPARARAEARTRRLLPARLAPRARVPLAVLVVEVRVRPREHRGRAGEAVPRLLVHADRAATRVGRRSPNGR